MHCFSFWNAGCVPTRRAVFFLHLFLLPAKPNGYCACSSLIGVCQHSFSATDAIIILSRKMRWKKKISKKQQPKPINSCVLHPSMKWVCVLFAHSWNEMPSRASQCAPTNYEHEHDRNDTGSFWLRRRTRKIQMMVISRDRAERNATVTHTVRQRATDKKQKKKSERYYGRKKI